ncbi:MAG TPA: NADH-quinone oxidoreductase subunit NuoH [Candidatus Bathyarchaeia archaeon]|nr:MAG: NADH dehydrogenase [Candidatus Bathyarchaeota archaeon RBG_16_48_13]HJX23817.1 NADH-quinone oxidoreductase subunit NuoH [Candidatus Bathyarchaeia archaeon]
MNVVEQLLQILLSPTIIIPLIFPGLLTTFLVIIFIAWFERKLTAKVQLRYGPLYVLKSLGGLPQLVADLLKFLFTEIIIPKGSDKKAFILSPIFLFTLSMLPVVAIPLSNSYAAFFSDLSLLLVLALLTITPIFMLLLGWSSNNKFSFIGSLRDGYLMMAYEIPMFVSILAMAVAYDTLDLVQVVGRQSSGLWGIALNPLAAITFFVAMLMTTARFPFDVAEAESELVIGPYTEYSGIIFVLCLGASYAKLSVLSLFFAEVFLGGWNPLIWPLTLNPILPGVAVFVKGLLVMGLCVFMRSIYPRFRIDQVLKLGWHTLFVLSVASVALSLGIVWVLGF